MPAAHHVAAALALLLLSAAAPAQTLKDPALEALYRADRRDELQRTAARRLADQPDDAQAVLGVALASLMQDDAAPREAALRQARACVGRQPQAAACQYALGTVMAVQAMSEGMMKMARSAGAVKEALTAAHTLDPAWYPARSALFEFHAQAPALMGGSSSKAAELARSAPSPEQVKVLQARLAASDRKFEQAVAAFMALPSGLDPALAEDARAWAVQAGLGLLSTGGAAKAQPLFEQLAREYPKHAGPAYAMARTRGEAGAHEEAVKLYTRAADLQGASEWPIAYRMGLSLQALGRNDAARAAYARFVAAGKGSAKSLDDAKQRLAQLGGPPA